jgi:hypothetical protein
MVANLILLYSLKTYLSFKTWKQLCKKTWAILFIYFFQASIKVPIVLDILDTCPFFSIIFFVLFLFFMNNFLSRPVFQRRPSTRYMCAQKVDTYNNRIKISKQCLYKAGNENNV